MCNKFSCLSLFLFFFFSPVPFVLSLDLRPRTFHLYAGRCTFIPTSGLTFKHHASQINDVILYLWWHSRTHQTISLGSCFICVYKQGCCIAFSFVSYVFHLVAAVDVSQYTRTHRIKHNDLITNTSYNINEKKWNIRTSYNMLKEACPMWVEQSERKYMNPELLNMVFYGFPTFGWYHLFVRSQ